MPAETQCEKSLPERGDDDIEQADGFQRLQRRLQIEAQTGGGAGQRAAADAEAEQQQEQSGHHQLGDPLHSLLQSEVAGDRTDQNGQQHISDIASRRGEKTVEITDDFLFIPQSGHRTVQVVDRIGDHPAGHGGVEDHQESAAGEEHRSRPVPLEGTSLRQGLVGAIEIAPAGAAERKLHHHHGKAEHEQENQIDQYEKRAAVLAGHERKTPDVAETDRASRGQQDEAEPGTQCFPRGTVIAHDVSFIL